ncbi:acyltransferase family protein [uncultured Robinsoniella sp.]|uniref:acyltransferase family protein n=1 Tax=uncultured Robinsoniella sp. TaxID=904190 RepID=UPI00374E341A
MKNLKKTNYFTNYLKGLACLGIVLVHCRFPSAPGAVITAFARSGIPFFFMLSGYYTFYTDREKTLAVTGRRVKKTFQLLVTAMFFYIAWRFLPKLLSGGIQEAFLWVKTALFQQQIILEFLLLNVTDSVNGVLWYIPAALYVYMMFGILVKSGSKWNALYIAALILLAVNLVLCEIGSLAGLGIHLKWYRNFLLTGFPLFMLGHYLHKKEKEIQMLKRNTPILIAALGGAMILLECRLVGNALLYTGNVVFIIGLYLYAIQNSLSKKGTLMEQVGSKLYLYIYISQVAVIETMDKLTERVSFFEGTMGLYVKPVLVLAAVVLLSALLYYTKSKLTYRK